VRKLESRDKIIMMKMKDEKNYNENTKTVNMNCFVYSLTHRHATGLCAELFLDIGIIGHGLSSQALCNYTVFQKKVHP